MREKASDTDDANASFDAKQFATVEWVALSEHCEKGVSNSSIVRNEIIENISLIKEFSEGRGSCSTSASESVLK